MLLRWPPELTQLVCLATVVALFKMLCVYARFYMLSSILFQTLRFVNFVIEYFWSLFIYQLELLYSSR